MTIGSSCVWMLGSYVEPGELGCDLGVDGPPLRGEQRPVIAAPLRTKRLDGLAGIELVSTCPALAALAGPWAVGLWLYCSYRWRERGNG